MLRFSENNFEARTTLATYCTFVFLRYRHQIVSGMASSHDGPPPPPRVHVVVARRAEVHVAPGMGGLLADVAPAAGLEAGEREVVLAAVLGEGDGGGEAEARRVDVEVALAAAEADAGDPELARVAAVGRSFGVVVLIQRVLRVEQAAPDGRRGTSACHLSLSLSLSPCF